MATGRRVARLRPCPGRLRDVERRPSRLGVLACVLALVCALTTGSASAATAPPVLPLGTDGHGVHLRVQPHHPKRLVLTFDDSAAAPWQRVAGRLLEIDCYRFGGRAPAGVVASNASVQGAPHHRKRITVFMSGRYDLCSVGVQQSGRTTILTWIPLTRIGAARLDESETARAVIGAVRVLGGPERPSAAAVAARLHGVVLADPAQAPPPGVLGVYSDGIAHVYAAETDLGGTLLFVEENGSVTRTNILGALLGQDGL